jgi:aryl-alcohol dehydrogenase-like predicted oxidoreductase
MILRFFGDSALSVSRIGLGLAALGRPGYINLGHETDLAGDYAVGVMEQRCHVVIDAAWNAGIRYFDTARSYGRGESFLGSWLRSRQIEPKQVAVGSKWGYTYTADWQVQATHHEVKEHSLAVLNRQWAESRHELGEQLDLYQIHSATLESGVLRNREVLTRLAALKADGVRIGLSLSGPGQAATLEEAVKVRIDGVRLFDGVQATWNLLEPSAGAALYAARKEGLGVLVKEALANGRLTGRNTDPAFRPQRSLLEQEAARLGCTVDALALAAVLAQPWADVVLSGAATVAQLSSNLTALAVPWDGRAAAALQTLAQPAADYWAARGGMGWN